MNRDQYDAVIQFFIRLLEEYQFVVILFIVGTVLLFIGVAVSSYNRKVLYLKRPGKSDRVVWNPKTSSIVDKVTSIYPLISLKENIKSNLYIGQTDEEKLNLYSGIIVLAFILEVVLNTIFLRKIGQLWYVKLLILAMSVLLPYYILTLGFDLYRNHISRNIPQMIDEFRSAFIKYRKVKPALKECSRYIDKRLAVVISSAADATYMEENLIRIRDTFKNTWFNIFVALIINFKNNGGELIDQLYRLNKTMTRYNNYEKKKNKRLIWYELFSVVASVISIPAVFWINSAILGSDAGVLADAQTNIIISRIIGFSILSLIVVRILRRL